METDILILGSPIYFGSVTGEMQSFLERLQFPFLIYTDPPTSIFLGKIRTGFIFTLGADENMAKERGFDARIAAHEFILKMILEIRSRSAALTPISSMITARSLPHAGIPIKRQSGKTTRTVSNRLRWRKDWP